MEMRNMNTTYTSQGVVVPGPSKGTGYASDQMSRQEFLQYAQALGFRDGEDIPISATPIIELERYKRVLEINHKMQFTYAEMEAAKQQEFEEQADKQRTKAAKWKSRGLGFMVHKHENRAVKLSLKAHEHQMAHDNYASLAKQYGDERKQFTPPKDKESKEEEAKEKKEEKEDTKDKVKGKEPEKKEKPIKDTKITDKTNRDAQPGPSQTGPPKTEETEEEKRRRAETEEDEDEDLDEEAEEEEQMHALSMMTSQAVVKDPPHPFHHPDAPHNIRRSAPSVPTGPHRPKQGERKTPKDYDDDDEDDTDSDDDDEYEYEEQRKKGFWNYVFPVQPSYTQDVSTAAIRNAGERTARGNLSRSTQGTNSSSTNNRGNLSRSLQGTGSVNR